MFSPKDKKEIKGKRNLNLKREAGEKVFFPFNIFSQIINKCFLKRTK
jgi:hypothetical protein